MPGQAAGDNPGFIAPILAMLRGMRGALFVRMFRALTTVAVPA